MKTLTKRIYYGPNGGAPFWTVKVSKAKKSVVINGNAFDALRGKPGETVGCAMSNLARTNQKYFPHPVFLAVVTKSRVWIVDKVSKDNVPLHAVHYEHHYGHITDDNDSGVLKKMVKENPELMERSFKLLVPRKQKSQVGAPSRTGNDTGTGSRAVVKRGALKRAVQAGFVSPGVAGQLEEVAAG